MLFKDSLEKHEMLRPPNSILIAVSGGADSTALLYSLADLREIRGLTLHAAHINHNLRGRESDEDAAFVKNLCESLGIPLYIYSADVKKEARGKSLEEAARTIRYAYLCQAAKACGANKIALGHNLNDNAETIILNLCRGTGLAGLGGIPPTREHKGYTLIRPLIDTTREEIIDF